MSTVQNQRQNKLITVLIVVLGAVGGYIYYSQTSASEVEIPALPYVGGNKDTLAPFKDFSIDFSVLTNANFEALRIYGEAPVAPSITTRRDLFSPL